MKNKIVNFLIFVLILFYISGFSSFGVQLLFFGSIGIIGYFLITLRLKKTLAIFNNKELLIIILIFIIYIIFSLRSSIFDNKDKNIFKNIICGLQHIVVLYLLAIHGLKNLNNAITLTRIFAIVLFLSFIFFNIGFIIFPEQFIQLRYALYGKYYEQLIEEGLFSMPSLLLAGLTPDPVRFGYQVTAGFLIISLFFIEKHRYWKLFLISASIFVFTALIVIAERSVVAAFVAGFVIYIMLLHRRAFTLKKVIRMHLILLLLLGTYILLFYKMEYILDFNFMESTNRPIKLLHERFGLGDIGIRLGMQLAALEIISEKPLGLFAEGMKEEDWGYLANEKGYEVVPDANNIAYALVHNGYLRPIMYFGWIIGLGIIFILIYLFRQLKYFKAKIQEEDSERKKYGRAIASVLVALLVQAMFHNYSLFTFEKATWITFCLFMIWVKLNKTNLGRKHI